MYRFGNGIGIDIGNRHDFNFNRNDIAFEQYFDCLLLWCGSSASTMPNEGMDRERKEWKKSFESISGLLRKPYRFAGGANCTCCPLEQFTEIELWVILNNNCSLWMQAMGCLTRWRAMPLASTSYFVSFVELAEPLENNGPSGVLIYLHRFGWLN